MDHERIIGFLVCGIGTLIYDKPHLLFGVETISHIIKVEPVLWCYWDSSIYFSFPFRLLDISKNNNTSNNNIFSKKGKMTIVTLQNVTISQNTDELYKTVNYHKKQ